MQKKRPSIPVRQRLLMLSKMNEIGDVVIVDRIKLVTAKFWLTCYHNIPSGAIEGISDKQRAYRFEAEQVGDDVKIMRTQ